MVKVTRDKFGLHIFLDRARVPMRDAQWEVSTNVVDPSTGINQGQKTVRVTSANEDDASDRAEELIRKQMKLQVVKVNSVKRVGDAAQITYFAYGNDKKSKECFSKSEARQFLNEHGGGTIRQSNSGALTEVKAPSSKVGDAAPKHGQTVPYDEVLKKLQDGEWEAMADVVHGKLLEIRYRTGTRTLPGRTTIRVGDTDTTSTKLKVAQGTHPKVKTPTVSHMQSSPQARQIAERIKEFQKDMSPEKFDGLKTLLNEFLSEESEEPEHARDSSVSPEDLGREYAREGSLDELMRDLNSRKGLPPEYKQKAIAAYKKERKFLMSEDGTSSCDCNKNK